MYNFELRLTEVQTAQTETLRIVESICEEFQLHEHFGIISTTLHDLIGCVVDNTAESENLDVALIFLIDPEKIAVLIQNVKKIEALKKLYQSSNIQNPNQITTADILTDLIEFKEEEKELYFEFHVKPYIKSLRTTSKETEVKKFKDKFTY